MLVSQHRDWQVGWVGNTQYFLTRWHGRSLKQMTLAGEEITKAACTDNLDAEGVDMEELDKVVDKKLDCLRDLLIDADKLR